MLCDTYNDESDCLDDDVWERYHSRRCVSRKCDKGYLFRDEGSEYARAMIDLKDASRDELIRLVVAQHQTIQRQERTIADLHAEVARLTAQVSTLTAWVGTLIAALEAATRTDDRTGSGGAPGMPGLRPANARVPVPKRERRRRGQLFACNRRDLPDGTGYETLRTARDHRSHAI